MDGIKAKGKGKAVLVRFDPGVFGDLSNLAQQSRRTVPAVVRMLVEAGMRNPRALAALGIAESDQLDWGPNGGNE